nr:hypothetical protein [uncultured Celeribacter sp.]
MSYANGQCFADAAEVFGLVCANMKICDSDVVKASDFCVKTEWELVERCAILMVFWAKRLIDHGGAAFTNDEKPAIGPERND